LNAESGEIVTSGGRQGIYQPTTNSDPLQKTRGCVRFYDADIADVKTQTDLLDANDELELPGTVTVTDDLKEFRGSYYTPADYNTIQQNIKSSTNVTGGLLNATTKEAFKNVLNTNVGAYQQGVEGATENVEGISPSKPRFE